MPSSKFDNQNHRLDQLTNDPFPVHYLRTQKEESLMCKSINGQTQTAYTDKSFISPFQFTFTANCDLRR